MKHFQVREIVLASSLRDYPYSLGVLIGLIIDNIHDTHVIDVIDVIDIDNVNDDVIDDDI